MHTAAGPGGVDSLLHAVDAYYSARALRYGATARAADWDSHLSQYLRFAQLLQVIDWRHGAPITLHDLGCGYGALLAYVRQYLPTQAAGLRYVGTDLSTAMIGLARQRWPEDPSAQFHPAHGSMPAAHYTAASGIFHVCLGRPRAEWERHVGATLAQMRAASRLGFAVNFLSPTAHAARPDAAGALYTTGADRWVAYCRDVLQCRVRVLAGYGLDEFTLLAQIPEDSSEAARTRSTASCAP